MFVIVVASVLIGLRRRAPADPVAERGLRPAALLLAAGWAGVVTLLMWVATAGPLDTSLSDYFAARSVPDANGRNVVNVILVDFRALDTLGEISVVLLSLLAAWPLLQALRRREPAP